MPPFLMAQENETGLDESERKSINITVTTGPIKLDGELDEPAWEKADKTSEFHQYFPFDSVMASAPTSIRMVYDEEFIYVGVKMQDPDPGGYVTSTLRRDFRGRGNDGIHLLFDTFDDHTNAFLFGVNPFNVQREGIISGGGNGNGSFSLTWDNKWYSAAKQHDGYWIAEIAIPFKSIRFKEGATHWGFNAFRIDSKQNERSSWGNIPRNYSIVTLGFTGKILWDKPLKKPGANISVIPYISGSSVKNHEEGTPAENKLNFGGDAKIAVSPSINLDLTVNPDFSQVEVDRQVTNLDRFELFFPERRQFFLENADLFSNFGFNRIRPFFSRRIGIAYDSIQETNVQNQILYGARLSGKLNKDWRIGLLNMQTSKDDKIGLPSNNYTVAVVERRLFQRSTISAFMVNKQPMSDTIRDKFTLNPEYFNRVLGMDYNLATNDNKWQGKLFYHRSFNETDDDRQFAHGLKLLYRERAYELEWNHEMVGENFDAEVGFVPRTGYNRVNPEFRLNYYPNSKWINKHGPGLDLSYTWDRINNKTDHSYEFQYEFDFQNLARLSIGVANNFTYLFDEFDPSGSDGIPLPEGTSYNYTNFEINFQSDLKKSLYYDFEITGGEYFNGSRYGIEGNFNFRAQPLAIFSLSYSYNRVRLPAPYSDSDLFLIGPRVDLTFSRNIFFTTFVQYNDQIENININARFQWRYKPVSDLFIVYTDNYFPHNLKVKNRALVLKLTYWMNI